MCDCTGGAVERLGGLDSARRRTPTRPWRLTRRQLLVGTAAGLVAASLRTTMGCAPPVDVGRLLIHPRTSWGADLAPRGPLFPEDVRFLLVHHGAMPNSYAPGDVPGLLRSAFLYQTGSAKRWPDVSYNFFVDRFGGVWEGRTGSLAGPVMADATGGSQGFAQLVCLLGDFTVQAPTAEMTGALVALLAFLADRHGLNVDPAAPVTFTSRGLRALARGRHGHRPSHLRPPGHVVHVLPGRRRLPPAGRRDPHAGGGIAGSGAGTAVATVVAQSSP